ncbi:MAG: hypothetical protein ACI8RD_008046, partial [Bacillariaceae sp.]
LLKICLTRLKFQIAVLVAGHQQLLLLLLNSNRHLVVPYRIQIQRLIDAKTITIGRLIELMPEGTVDPTPFIYDTTCYAAAGLMGIGLLANLAIRPLDYVKIVDELNNNNKI